MDGTSVSENVILSEAVNNYNTYNLKLTQENIISGDFGNVAEFGHIDIHVLSKFIMCDSKTVFQFVIIFLF